MASNHKRTMNTHQLKLEICDIGRRIYNKGFAAGNDGNVSYRLSEKEVLCTPTLISKGFMKPEDLCVVDMHGHQLSGTRKPPSKLRSHLTPPRERQDVNGFFPSPPPPAAPSAVAGEPIPQCVLPEI